MPKAEQKPTTAMGRRMLTRAQAAEFLSVSCATMARWAGDRQGPPFVKLADGGAGSVRYPADMLEDFVASRLKTPKQDGVAD